MLRRTLSVNQREDAVDHPVIEGKAERTVKGLVFAIAFLVAGLMGCKDKERFVELSVPNFGNTPDIVDTLKTICVVQTNKNGQRIVPVSEWLNTNPRQELTNDSVVDCPK